mgnify:CR=1 FL=1
MQPSSFALVTAVGLQSKANVVPASAAPVTSMVTFWHSWSPTPVHVRDSADAAAAPLALVRRRWIVSSSTPMVGVVPKRA